MSIIKDFQDFAMKGDLLELAVAFVMGVAFTALIMALVTDIVSPLIGIPGHVNFASITYTVNGSTFLIGAFINSIIAFISVTAAVFFFIVKPVMKMQEKMNSGKTPPSPTTKTCPYCISTIPLKATRCPNCTSKL